jgi:hypothetical protein
MAFSFHIHVTTQISLGGRKELHNWRTVRANNGAVDTMSNRSCFTTGVLSDVSRQRHGDVASRSMAPGAITA